MIVLYSFIALYIAWIWIDYFRIIDLFEREKLSLLVAALLIGFASAPIALHINTLEISAIFGFTVTGPITQLIECILNIGFIEEFSKLIPATIFYMLFKKKFNEPIDFIIFFAISGLGFSVIENILFFKTFGPKVIVTRGILCSVGHMFFSAITAYGILSWKLKKSTNGLLTVLFYFFFGVVVHGMYDFFIMESSIQPAGIFLNLLLFFVLVSVFSTILNNALNVSPFFSYSKVIHGRLLGLRLSMYYLILFSFQGILLFFVENEKFKDIINLKTMLTILIVWITVFRLSHFKLIWERWEDIKFQLPFAFKNTSYFKVGNRGFHIRGESWNEAETNQHYQKSVPLYFLKDARKIDPHVCKIVNKIHDQFDDPIFVAELYSSKDPEKKVTCYLIAKRGKSSIVADKYPVLGMLTAQNDLQVITRNKEVKFEAWVYLQV
jgi:RsiW-degrading membrane proteinase PrsW (M82 family)